MSAVVDIEVHLIAVGTTALTASANLSMASISNASIVDLTAIQGGPAIPRRFSYDAYLGSGSPNTVTVERRDDDDAMTVAVTVVDWDAAYVDVQSGTYDSTVSSGSDTATLGTSVTVDKTWVWHGMNTNGVGWRDSMVTAYIASTTTVDFDSSYTGNNTNGTFYTMEDVDGGIWDTQVVDASSAAAQHDITLASTVTMGTSFLALSQSNNRFNRYSEQVGTCYLLDSDTIRRLKNEAVGSLVIKGHVVSLLQGGSSVQRGDLAFTSAATTDTATITAVDLAYSWVGSPVGFYNSLGSGNDNTSVQETCASLEFNSTTEIEGNIFSNSNSVTVRWQVIEFEAPGGALLLDPILMSVIF